MHLFPVVLLKFFEAVSCVIWIFVNFDVPNICVENRTTIVGLIWLLFSTLLLVTIQVLTRPSKKNTDRRITLYMLYSALGTFAYLLFNFFLWLYIGGLVSSRSKCRGSTEHSLSGILGFFSFGVMFLELGTVALFLNIIHCEHESAQSLADSSVETRVDLDSIVEDGSQHT
jgi:hypothetical protein